MSTTTLGFVTIIVLVFIVAFWIAGRKPPKRPKPQQPPSDRERFRRMKGDWEDKQ